MKGYLDFIVEPVNGRYNNKKSIDGQELIINTEIQGHESVNRVGKVISVPVDNDTEIKQGDLVIVHHNVFRRFRDVRGVEKNSRSHYKDDKYFVKQDQIYAYKRNKRWEACKGFNFIKPIKETKMFSSDSERPLIGILFNKDKHLDTLNNNDLVGFKPGYEYEFIIDNNRLYRVPTNAITIKYEYQGDEEEYNPSWAQGS